VTFKFREVVVVDAEFTTIAGERSGPVCVVAREMRSGRIFRIFQGQFGPGPPYATGPDVLVVVFVGAAEFGVYHNLSWPQPEHVLDLFAEFRNYTNMGSKEDQAERTPNGRSLLGASLFFGLPVINSDEKTGIQKAIGSDTWRGVYTPKQILDYCQSDVDATARLLTVLLPKITSLPHALLRGRYTKAGAIMEQTGIPMDVELHELIQQERERIISDLITTKEIAGFGIYTEDGAERVNDFETAQC
jgi:DNA polymerase-1